MDTMPALNPLLTEDVIPFLNVTHLGIESNKLEGDDFSYGRSRIYVDDLVLDFFKGRNLHFT